MSAPAWRAACAGLAVIATLGMTATAATATTDEWATSWCDASTKFETAIDKADSIGNKLYGAAMSGGGGLAGLKRQLVAAATTARNTAKQAVTDLTAAGAPEGPDGENLQKDALAAWKAADKALQQALSKLDGFDPGDPKSTIKTLRSAGSRGAAGRATSAYEEFQSELDDALTDNPVLEQALTTAGCA